MRAVDFFILSFSSGFSANFNQLKALALELGVHGQRCAQFHQDKSVSVQMVKIEADFWLRTLGWDATPIHCTAV